MNFLTNVRRVFQMLAPGIVFCVALAAIYTTVGDQPAVAQVRNRNEPQTAFKSGGARSELVLLEIAGTLKVIDARLERLETQFSGKGRPSGKANGNPPNRLRTQPW